MKKRYASMEDRIIANSVLSREHFWTDPATGETTACWEWTGKVVRSRNGNGRAYPVMVVRVPGKGPRNVRVHRVVLKDVKGLRMTKDHVGAHKCNYTFCVNFEHVRRDTQGGNMEQCVREGRHVSGYAVAHVKRDFDDLDAAA